MELVSKNLIVILFRVYNVCACNCACVRVRGHLLGLSLPYTSFEAGSQFIALFTMSFWEILVWCWAGIWACLARTLSMDPLPIPLFCCFPPSTFISRWSQSLSSETFVFSIECSSSFHIHGPQRWACFRC